MFGILYILNIGGVRMELFEAIYSRRTVRDFNETRIDPETIKRIIDAGLQAPTNNHMREWEFIVINDLAARLEIIQKVNKEASEEDAIEMLEKWRFTDKYQRDMYIDSVPKQYAMLLNCGCLIIPCFRHTDLLKPKNLSSLNAFASIWCCIENMLLAAVCEGIYGVTRIPFDEEIDHIKRTANIPGDYEIPCYIALGYPKENPDTISQHIVKAEDRIHYSKW
jgi:nitroreductase